MPLETVKFIAPVLPPKQFTFVTEGVNVKPVEAVTVAEVVDIQLFASVTVTVYVPAAKPVRFCVVMPPPQL